MSEGHRIEADYEATGTMELWVTGSRIKDDIELTNGSAGRFECSCGEDFPTQMEAEQHLYEVYDL